MKKKREKDERKEVKERKERQAVTKDLTSSSKFSGSSVLTLQTQRINDEPIPERKEE